MKFTGFKFTFNPKRAFYTFLKTLSVLGFIGGIWLTIIFWILVADDIRNNISFLVVFGAIMFQLFSVFGLIIGLVHGVSWIIEHGDKEIEINLTDIKLNRKSKYKELP